MKAWLLTKNESAAESLREAFEELLTLHRLKVPAMFRKTLLSTNSMRKHVLVGPTQRAEHQANTRQLDVLQRWIGTVLLARVGNFKRVKRYAEIAQVISTIEVKRSEPHSTPTKRVT